MPVEQDLTRLIEAIRLACAEHGVPNRFSPGDLAAYGGPSPMIAGRLGTMWNVKLRNALPEFRVRYADRMFAVDPA